VKRKQFIESVRQSLLQRRDELLNNVSGPDSQLRSLGRSTELGDSADQASDTLASEISAKLADVEFREIANIDKAISRMNDESYGVCEGCRKNIPLKRLEAIPHASVCITCKQLAEEHGIDEGSTVDWTAIFGANDSFSNPDASVS
jgi:DnaK suppressor protein